VTVEAMVEIRPRRGLPERVWLTEGGAPKQALSGTAEVRILGEGGEAPAGSPALLAALEVERLRAALRRAWTMLARDANGACSVLVPYGNGSTIPCGDAPIAPHDPDCPFAVLADPPPDLGPLRELVAATVGFAGASEDGTQGPIGRARDALLAAYPCLGEE
jgi:hypothetical protein